MNSKDGQKNVLRWKKQSGHAGFLLFVVLAILFAPAVRAENDPTLDVLKFNAQKYYWGKDVRQDLPKALTFYLLAAQKGDTEAQFIVGGMYFQGIGTEKNPKEGFKWLYMAAKNGESTPKSQKILGQAFLQGNVVPQNYTESLQWYHRAAENGDHDAQNELAFLYYVGKGVEQDFKTSFEWFEKAARGGLPVAQYNVGIMYYTGNGVEQTDLLQAYTWLSLAAANGHNNASAASKYLETLLNASELKQAQQKATQLYNEINAKIQEKNTLGPASHRVQ
jgi:uncharacterized protein